MTRRAPPDRLVNPNPAPRARRVARRLARHTAMADRVRRETLANPTTGDTAMTWFTMDNTKGYSDADLRTLNTDFETRLATAESAGIPDDIRSDVLKNISEQVLADFAAARQP